MGISCWVSGCESKVGGEEKVGFFTIPTVREHEGEFTKKLTEDRRRMWLANINRKDAPTKYSKVCSTHFLNGRPASMYDRSNPDWAPSLNLNTAMTPTQSLTKKKRIESASKRYNRVRERQKLREKHNAARLLLGLHSALHAKQNYDQLEMPIQMDQLEMPIQMDQSVPHRKCCTFLWRGRTERLEQKKISQTVTAKQTNSELQRLLTENMELKSELNSSRLTHDSFVNDDEKVKYYTGLPNYLTLMVVYNIVAPFLPMKINMKLNVFERLLMTLMRLKLNLPLQDLAYRFKSSTSTVSRTFLVVVHIMYVRLKHLIYWPEKEELTTLSDDEEVNGEDVELQSSLKLPEIPEPSAAEKEEILGQLYSAKSKTSILTVSSKYQTELLPTILQDGKLPDLLVNLEDEKRKEMTTESELRNECEVIFANVNMSEQSENVEVITQDQANLKEVHRLKMGKITHVRINVERVIGIVRNRCLILQGKVPSDLLIHDKNEIPVIDKITTVCCALINLNESVVLVDMTKSEKL